VQTLRALIDGGAVRFTGERWEWQRAPDASIPTPIADLIERRLSQLPFESRRTLAAAAILGREFDLELAVDAGVAPEPQLITAIEDGIRAAVLAPPGQASADRYTFAHGLLAEMLVEGMVPRRRRTAHERAAQALLRRAPGAASEIAWHFDEADDSPNAYRFALQAAAQSRVVYAHDEADRFLLIAERHANSPAELAEVRAQRGELAEAAGRYDDAESLYDLAIGWFAGQGDRFRTLSLRRRRERVLALLGRAPRETIEAVGALLAEAQQLGSERERVALLDLLSEAHARLGEHAAAERAAWTAVHAAGALGDATLRADALDRLAVTVARLHPDRAIEVYRQALALYERSGDVRGEAVGLAHLGTAHLRRGRWREAQEAIDRAIAVAGPAAPPDLRGYLALCLGTVNLKRGEYARARELLNDAMRLFAAVRSGDLQLDALLSLAYLERERGEPAASSELYDAAVAFARRLGSVEAEVAALAGGGLARLALDDREAATSASSAADALATTRPEWFDGRELADALAIRAAALRGDLAEAWRRFEVASAAAAQSDSYGAAWLTAECADVLLAHDPAGMRRSVARYLAPLVDVGATPVRDRYEALLAAAG
jgi:tetratricopeptide (TPR) repeat protein